LALIILLCLAMPSFSFSQEVQPVPDDYNLFHPDYKHGELKDIEYFSSIKKSNQKAKVYTPPGYKPSKKYPLLYLLHGINGNEGNWIDWSGADKILDNLYHFKKITAM